MTDTSENLEALTQRSSTQLFTSNVTEMNTFNKLLKKYSTYWLVIRILLLVIVLAAAIFLSWWYNTDNVNDSVKTNTRYTWLTWLETLDRVSGLALGILITLVTRLIIAKGTKELKQNKIFEKLEAILKKSE